MFCNSEVLPQLMLGGCLGLADIVRETLFLVCPSKPPCLWFARIVRETLGFFCFDVRPNAMFMACTHCTWDIVFDVSAQTICLWLAQIVRETWLLVCPSKPHVYGLHALCVRRFWCVRPNLMYMACTRSAWDVVFWCVRPNSMFMACTHYAWEVFVVSVQIPSTAAHANTVCLLCSERYFPANFAFSAFWFSQTLQFFKLILSRTFYHMAHNYIVST